MGSLYHQKVETIRCDCVNLKRSLQIYTPELPKSKAAADFNFYVIIDS